MKAVDFPGLSIEQGYNVDHPLANIFYLECTWLPSIWILLESVPPPQPQIIVITIYLQQ